MRFFAHDGKTLLGPAEPEELLQKPGFDGDTLVCPVGSENSADWKPALSYPVFRDALLAPKLKTAPPPQPSTPPPPPPTAPCPRCKHDNPMGARFCNECGVRMDRAMGRMSALEETETPSPGLPTIVPEPAPEPAAQSAPVSGPVVPLEPAAAPAMASSWKKTALAAFLSAVVAGGGLGWWLLKPRRARPRPFVAAPAPIAARVAATAVAAPPVARSTPTVAAAPVAAPPPIPSRPAAKPAPPPASPAPKLVAKRVSRRKKARRVLLLRNGSDEKAAAAPAKSSTTADSGFLLPGVPKPVAATPTKSGAPAPPPAPAPADDAASSGGGDDQQVREQIDFCAQLLAQSAFIDHFDTCLCASARQAPPYKGLAAVYVAEMKKLASSGVFQSPVPPQKVAVDGSTAKVAIKRGGAVAAETWKLEDGLWCRAP